MKSELHGEVIVDGQRRWYWHGKLHRTVGPAVQDDCTEEWWLYGQLHRGAASNEIQLPARVVKLEDGVLSEWWQHGRRHRLDGAAIEFLTDDGKENRREWWYQGSLHRIGGPAAEGLFLGDLRVRQEWWFHGMLHREDGPAVTRADGTEAWWIAGKPVDPPDNMAELLRLLEQ